MDVERRAHAPHKSVREGGTFCIELDPANIVFHVNYSAGAHQSVDTCIPFIIRTFRSADCMRRLLSDASNFEVSTDKMARDFPNDADKGSGGELHAEGRDHEGRKT